MTARVSPRSASPRRVQPAPERAPEDACANRGGEPRCARERRGRAPRAGGTWIVSPSSRKNAGPGGDELRARRPAHSAAESAGAHEHVGIREDGALPASGRETRIQAAGEAEVAGGTRTRSAASLERTRLFGVARIDDDDRLEREAFGRRVARAALDGPCRENAPSDSSRERRKSAGMGYFRRHGARICARRRVTTGPTLLALFRGGLRRPGDAAEWAWKYDRNPHPAPRPSRWTTAGRSASSAGSARATAARDGTPGRSRGRRHDAPRRAATRPTKTSFVSSATRSAA